MELNNGYGTIKITKIKQGTLVTLNRPEHRNTIIMQLIEEVHDLLDRLEEDSSCRVVVFQGENGVFCTGMDFQELIFGQSPDTQKIFSSGYMSLIKRFTTSSKVIISLLDGEVLAGGVGIVAASDIVISTKNTNFCLSEPLWGLLPACVIPFLIRRVGFQKTYYMTLTTRSIHAEQAYEMGLIDELTDNLGDNLRCLLLRFNRISEETIFDLKAYFRKMWLLTEDMENTAVQEITRLMGKTKVREDIKCFLEQQKFPWESV